MKKIEAIIEPFKMDEVKRALLDLVVDGITVSEVRGQRHTEVYRGQAYNVDLLPKIKLEMVVAAERFDEVVLTPLRPLKPLFLTSPTRFAFVASTWPVVEIGTVTVANWHCERRYGRHNGSFVFDQPSSWAEGVIPKTGPHSPA